MKSAMRKTLGGNYVSRCELETILHEVEASVNSKPLMYIEENPDIVTPFTPSHFLTGRSTGFQNHVEPSVSLTTSIDLSYRETLREQMLAKFWRLWSHDYIRNLPPVVKGFKSHCDLKKGDVVLLQEDNVPRLRWPLGLIVDVFPDQRGVIRSAKIKTACGVLSRSVQRLHNLEIASSGTLASDNESDVQGFPSDITPPGTCEEADKECTCSSRVVKPPLKLNL